MGDEDALVASALDVFDEDNIDSYARSVRENFAAGSKLNIATIRSIASRAGVPRRDGERGRYTRPMVIRDIMGASIRISEDVEPVPRAIVLNQWLSPEPEDSGSEKELPLDRDDDSDGDDLVASPDFTDPAATKKAWKMMMASMSSMQLALTQQQLRITRMATPGARREYGCGLNDFSLLQESKDLLWSETTNPFEMKAIKSKDFQEIVKDNSADELKLWRRPGLGAVEAKYCQKAEYSLKDVFHKFSSKTLGRLEPPMTTLVSAHSAVLFATESIGRLAVPKLRITDGADDGSEVAIPKEVRAVAQAAESDLDLAKGRLEAATSLLLSEYARICNETSDLISKKMSTETAEQLALLKKPEEELTSSMLTPAFIALLEEQRKKAKSLAHALDTKAAKAANAKGKRQGNGHRNTRNNKPTNKNKQPKSPVASKGKPSASPASGGAARKGDAAGGGRSK